MEKKTGINHLAIIACKKAGRILKEGFEKNITIWSKKKADKIIQKQFQVYFLIIKF